MRRENIRRCSFGGVKRKWGKKKEEKGKKERKKEVKKYNKCKFREELRQKWHDGSLKTCRERGKNIIFGKGGWG
jgi:hypothetical protein